MKNFAYYKSRLTILIIAIFLWLFVVTGREYEITCEIPLIVENVRPGKVLISEVPGRVEAGFKGMGRSLIYMRTFNNAELYLDISSIKYFYDFPLSPDQIKFPSSLQVTPTRIINPDTVHIILDEEIERSVPIIPQVQIETAPGFVVVGEIETAPQEILITGPLSIMKDIISIETSSLNLSDAAADLNQEIELISPHENIELSIDEVTVQASVERLTENFIRNIPIKVLNVPENLSVVVEPAVLTVKIRGPVSIVKEAGIDQITAAIVFPAVWEGGNNAFMPEVEVPEGVELVEFQPDSVFLTLIEN